MRALAQQGVRTGIYRVKRRTPVCVGGGGRVKRLWVCLYVCMCRSRANDTKRRRVGEGAVRA
jgi:hypothetical protein